MEQKKKRTLTARGMAKLRWKNVPKEDRAAHARMMTAARERKRALRAQLAAAKAAPQPSPRIPDAVLIRR